MDACYVCLEEEGLLFTNVCLCNSFVHAACLHQMVEECGSLCKVCNTTFDVERVGLSPVVLSDDDESETRTRCPTKRTLIIEIFGVMFIVFVMGPETVSELYSTIMVCTGFLMISATLSS
jgi:hypothetical protein